MTELSSLRGGLSLNTCARRLFVGSYANSKRGSQQQGKRGIRDMQRVRSMIPDGQLVCPGDAGRTIGQTRHFCGGRLPRKQMPSSNSWAMARSIGAALSMQACVPVHRPFPSRASIYHLVTTSFPGFDSMCLGEDDLVQSVVQEKSAVGLA